MVRFPDFKLAGKMREKSQVIMLGTQLADPASRQGMKKVLQRLQPYLPMIKSETGQCQKTLLLGDHGFCAIGK